jgi:hypothetical protein
MAKTIDVTYTTGVIAAREKYLLKDKIYRLCELSEREAFRMLVESGFGGGAETAIDSVDYEKLIAVEEENGCFHVIEDYKEDLIQWLNL